MAEFRVEHTFNCSEETFWSKIFFDPAYNSSLFSKRLKFSHWQETKREESPDKIVRVIEASPPMGDVPAALKSLVGDGVRYEERGVFERASKRYTVDVVPNRLADKIQVRIQITTQAAGPDRVIRRVNGTVQAKIFGVGGILEKKLIADLEKSYSKSAEFTNQWIADNSLG